MTQFRIPAHNHFAQPRASVRVLDLVLKSGRGAHPSAPRHGLRFVRRAADRPARSKVARAASPANRINTRRRADGWTVRLRLVRGTSHRRADLEHQTMDCARTPGACGTATGQRSRTPSTRRCCLLNVPW